MSPIYLDYAATTPLGEGVKKIMLESINCDQDFYNSGSSTYEQAEFVKVKIENSRDKIANTLGVLAREIIFTSGATESNNLAIKGVAFSNRNKGNHIITSKVEHKAVLDVCKYLETQGFLVTYLDVDSSGQIDINQLEAQITDQTIIISLMAVNNELGTKNDLYQIGQLAKRYGIYFHVDAAQGYGKVDIDIKEMNIDLLSVSGHKLYAPKGVGFLYIRSKRPRVKLIKQIHGGAQEFGFRAGTLANYQIFALGEAAEEMFAKKIKNHKHVSNLRKEFLRIINTISRVIINTNLENSYPGILSVTFEGVNGEALLALSQELCLSMGSACNSKAVESSHVLNSIGLTSEQASSTIRVSFGLNTSLQEVLDAAEILKKNVGLLRDISAYGSEGLTDV